MLLLFSVKKGPYVSGEPVWFKHSDSQKFFFAACCDEKHRSHDKPALIANLIIPISNIPKHGIRYKVQHIIFFIPGIVIVVIRRAEITRSHVCISYSGNSKNTQVAFIMKYSSFDNLLISDYPNWSTTPKQ